MIKSALIIGGTRGIGKATAEALLAEGWDVVVTGKRDLNVMQGSSRVNGFVATQGDRGNLYDAIVYSAGDITAYNLNAMAFSVAFYRLIKAAPYDDVPYILARGGVAIAISSVAADRPAKVNPHYAAAKAALESYARTLADSDEAKRNGWRIEVIRFDLVDTDMLKQLPPETLTGRTIISAEEAASQIVEVIHG